METKVCDSPNYFIHLVFHVTLSDPHPINQHCVVDLLLPDSVVVSLQISVLNISAIKS